MTKKATQVLKQRILDASRDRFLHDGFHRVTVEEIAAGLAMSKKTFYLAFSSKDRLVEHIVEDLLVEINTNLEAIGKSDENFVVKLHSILTFFGQIGERLEKPFLRDVQRQLPHLWTRIQEFRRRRINDHFSRLIDQGIREGYVKGTINRRIFIRSYLAAIEAIVTPSVLMVEPFSAREAIQGILEIFFRGILTTEGERTFKRLEKEPLSHESEGS